MEPKDRAGRIAQLAELVAQLATAVAEESGVPAPPAVEPVVLLDVEQAARLFGISRAKLHEGPIKHGDLLTVSSAVGGRRLVLRSARGAWPHQGDRRDEVRALGRERDAGVRRTKVRTVASWLEEWIAGRELVVRRTTVLGYRSDLPHILRTLGRTRIEQLTPEQVEAVYRDCRGRDLDGHCATRCAWPHAPPTNRPTSSTTTRRSHGGWPLRPPGSETVLGG